MNIFVLALASGGFLSYLPARYTALGKYFTGAGLLGTVEALLLVLLLPSEPLVFFSLVAVSFFLSVAIAQRAETLLGSHDDPRIVIDEIVGYWTSVLFLPRTGILLASALVVFRLLDVTKPWLIRKAAHLPGGWGIVCDDILAGLATNLLLQVLHFLKFL